MSRPMRFAKGLISPPSGYGSAGAVGSAEFFGINSALHEWLVAWSGNDFILDALKRVNRVLALLDQHLPREPDWREHRCREHLAILDLVERGELKRAADLLRNHIDQARTRTC